MPEKKPPRRAPSRNGKPAAKRLSGGAAAKKAGRTPIFVTVDDLLKARIRVAAATEGVSMAEFLRRAGAERADAALAAAKFS